LVLQVNTIKWFQNKYLHAFLILSFQSTRPAKYNLQIKNNLSTWPQQIIEC
jgi:hypothetical protein